MIHRQVVIVAMVGLTINDENKFLIWFFSRNSYGLIIRKLYKIYGFVIHKFYITHRLLIRLLLMD